MAKVQKSERKTKFISFLSQFQQPLHAHQLHLLARPAVGAADAEGDAGAFQAAVDVEAGHHQFALLQQMAVHGVMEPVLGFAEESAQA